MVDRSTTDADLTQAIVAELTGLYAEQERFGSNEYLSYHSARQAIASRVNSFIEYAEYLPMSGTVLDWGCQHAPDACMVRMARPEVQIHGCDFLPENRWPVFWNRAGLHFTTLRHHVSLPYSDETFDVVIGGGVLEHVAMDYESLKEIFRILKPGGLLVITHLPNRFSYVEFAARHFRKADFHHKLYTLALIDGLLKRAAFLPLKLMRHRLLPSNSLPELTKVLAPIERQLDRAWPLNLFCGDILAIGRKVAGF